jgi:hypothetical protein
MLCFVCCVLQSPTAVQVSDSDEEPVSKVPRLSGDSHSDRLTDDGSYFEVRPQCPLHEAGQLYVI